MGASDCAAGGGQRCRRHPPTCSPASGFVRNNPAILGTISLDLFAVLLGGATALLPIYARDILQTGPLGPRPAARRAGGRRAC